jgi:methylated-DNA-[protein]-cysteine S-methyltransferase
MTPVWRTQWDNVMHGTRRKASEFKLPAAYVDVIDESPGPFAFAVDEEGALLWLQFLDGAYPRTIEEELAQSGYEVARDGERTARARQELLEYCRGERQAFTLPLRLNGTDWQVAVWRALTRIPFGETRTYGELAAELGRPGAARAMGRANATNPISVVVPCHRVIGANGALTGYGGGLHIKERLLAHEARVLGS